MRLSPKKHVLAGITALCLALAFPALLAKGLPLLAALALVLSAMVAICVQRKS